MYKVLLIDNFDSFTYNLVHLLEGVDAEVVVVRNDMLHTIQVKDYTHVVISPGPGLPSEVNQVKQFVKPLLITHKILGVCLGHQILGELFGAELYQIGKVYHGIATEISVDTSSKLFKDLPNTFNVGRYHSWMVKDLPKELKITATDSEDHIMAFEHSTFNLSAVQFHPESILSQYGREVIGNWLSS
jgi:anthranilate synthase component II